MTQKLKEKSEYTSSENAVLKGGISRYVPSVNAYQTGMGVRWEVSLDLPNETYMKWIPKIVGDKNFRETIETRLSKLFEGTLQDPYYIGIKWNNTGVIFSTFGNACDVAIDGSDDDMGSFGGHNIDSPKQALILYTCLNVFSKEMLLMLDIYEADPESFSKKPDMDGEILTNIAFNKKGNAKLLRR
jgi:hypothetical protein